MRIDQMFGGMMDFAILKTLKFRRLRVVGQIVSADSPFDRSPIAPVRLARAKKARRSWRRADD
jgi:hypothetical protein